MESVEPNKKIPVTHRRFVRDVVLRVTMELKKEMKERERLEKMISEIISDGGFHNIYYCRTCSRQFYVEDCDSYKNFCFNNGYVHGYSFSEHSVYYCDECVRRVHPIKYYRALLNPMVKRKLDRMRPWPRGMGWDQLETSENILCEDCVEDLHKVRRELGL